MSSFTTKYVKKNDNELHLSDSSVGIRCRPGAVQPNYRGHIPDRGKVLYLSAKWSNPALGHNPTPGQLVPKSVEKQS